MEPVAIALLVILVVTLSVVVIRRARRRQPGRPAGPQELAGPAATPGGSGGGFRAEGLGAKIRAVFATDDAAATAGLETVLLQADVGPRGAADLVARVRARGPAGDPVALLRDEIVSILGPDEPFDPPHGRTSVILVVGVNGGGKTTTVGKLAAMLGAQGRSVMLAAADTFRAAAGEQLDVWAERAGATVVGQDRGADPGAVAFDATTAALARGIDVLLVDTAGRLHTKTPLMEELGKIRRVIEKAGGTIDETLLVLDAQTGQNGIAQARAFTEAVEVTGVVLTKTDGSARGGIVLAVREELGVPVRFVGVGEGVGDLRPFAAVAFADRLLG